MPGKYSFSLSDTQIGWFEAWKQQFNHLIDGPIGGTYSFTFTPTSIGTVVKVTMEYGFGGDHQTATLDLTEYNDF